MAEIVGDLRATVTSPGILRKKGKLSKAKRAGLNYERRAQGMIRTRYGNIVCNPWIEFLDDDDWKLCQPDAVVELPDRMLVLEMKLRQQMDAYAKIRNLYMPIVEDYWRKPVSGLQVTRSIRENQGFFYSGLQAEFDLPINEVGTWFLRV